MGSSYHRINVGSNPLLNGIANALRCRPLIIWGGVVKKQNKIRLDPLQKKNHPRGSLKKIL